MDFSFLAGTDLFRGISAEELERMQPCLRLYEKNYARDSVIYRAGDVIGDIGVVEKGSVNLVVNSYWGTSSILSHMERGEIFADAYAAIPGRELLCDVVACEDSTILFLPMQRAITLCQKNCQVHSRMVQNLFRLSAVKFLNLSNRMMHMTPKTIRERLLSYLSEQMIASGDCRFTIPFTRQQLSEYLGVDRSALSHELSKMQQEGLLETHKNEFILYSGIEKLGETV